MALGEAEGGEGSVGEGDAGVTPPAGGFEHRAVVRASHWLGKCVQGQLLGLLAWLGGME